MKWKSRWVVGIVLGILIGIPFTFPDYELHKKQDHQTLLLEEKAGGFSRTLTGTEDGESMFLYATEDVIVSEDLVTGNLIYTTNSSKREPIGIVPVQDLSPQTIDNLKKLGYKTVEGMTK